MSPRWSVILGTIALVSGSLLAAAGSADAATTAHSAGTAAGSHPGTTSVRPGGAKSGFVPGGVIQHAGGASAQQRSVKNQTESTNWSGYAATGSDGAFNGVSSSWTEPAASCSGRGDKYAAFWVGLDGYNSDSVEQTGTDSDCAGRTPDYYGWYEMYPADPVYFNNPVEPGDSISASVTFASGSSTYTLTLTDNTQGWTQQEQIQESGLANSSAEVITEAPSSETGVLPLADFGTINYGDSTVNGSSMDSQNPTSIIMVSQRGDQLDSTSGMDSVGDFSNTWLASS
jgi:Peptidase A4 family